MKKLWMSWSTGKDSAYALFKLQQNPGYEITGLFTSLNESFDRVAMHSTRSVLLQQQSDALGLPWEPIFLPADCTNDLYEERMRMLITKAQAAGVQAMGFGDLYLEDVRAYRERLLAGTGIEAVFPLWQQATGTLAREMCASGIEAVLTCVDLAKLPASFAGRFFNEETLADFPPHVDPCGENGEFHSFVYGSPSFARKIPVRVGETVEREGFLFADVLPCL